MNAKNWQYMCLSIVYDSESSEWVYTRARDSQDFENTCEHFSGGQRFMPLLLLFLLRPLAHFFRHSSMSAREQFSLLIFVFVVLLVFQSYVFFIIYFFPFLSSFSFVSLISFVFSTKVVIRFRFIAAVYI